jgi:hypothetical protein
MRKTSVLLLLVLLALPAFGQLRLPRASPNSTLTQTVGLTDISIKYSRPGVKGRQIWGALVPYDTIWRTGANEATTLETSADLVIGGNPIPAGKYSLWTIPSASAWKLIINKNTGQWGTEYDPQHDLVRLDMAVEPIAPPVEQFTIAIESQEERGVLKFEWARTQAWIPVSRTP